MFKELAWERKRSSAGEKPESFLGASPGAGEKPSWNLLVSLEVRIEKRDENAQSFHYSEGGNW